MSIRFSSLKEVYKLFSLNGSKLLKIVDKDGTELKVDRIPLVKEKIKWVCANNPTHTPISTFSSLLDRKNGNKWICRECAISKSCTTKNYGSFTQELEKEGWKMRSKKTDYKNTKTIMQIRCPSGHKLKISYNNWAAGHRTCKTCAYNDFRLSLLFKKLVT